MISDTLSEAVHELDDYLNSFEDKYCGQIRTEILKVRDDMEHMRSRLDSSLSFISPFHDFDGIREIECGSIPKPAAMVFFGKGIAISGEARATLLNLAASKGWLIGFEDGYSCEKNFSVLVFGQIKVSDFDSEAELFKYLTSLVGSVIV